MPLHLCALYVKTYFFHLVFNRHSPLAATLDTQRRSRLIADIPTFKLELALESELELELGLRFRSALSSLCSALIAMLHGRVECIHVR